MEQSKTIAIVGGGLSGLTSLKAALENGLTPTLFEKSGDIGGLWSPAASSMWDSMTTNISKYNCMFSDFKWKPEHTPESHDLPFPRQNEVHRYLTSYANYFKLHPYVKLNCLVTSVKKNQCPRVGQPEEQNSSFTIEFKDQSQSTAVQSDTQKMEFDFVIIASGVFSEGVIKRVPGDETFPGTISHSISYKNPKKYSGRRVALFGASSSGVEIASELASCGDVSEIVVFSKRNIFIIPKNVLLPGDSKKLPVDYISFSRKKYYDDKRSATEKNIYKFNFIASVSGQQDIESIKVRDPPESPIFIGISDHFIPLLRQEKIKYYNYTVSRIEGNRLYYEFSDDNKQKQESYVEVDDIIYCTGFYCNLGYLDQEILDAIEYDRSYSVMPTIAYNTVFPRGIKGLAFVGVYRGPYFGVCELQARWATGVFSGKLKTPTAEEIEAGMNVERKIRNSPSRLQFPHSDYIFFADAIAKAVGVLPNFEELLKATVESPDDDHAKSIYSVVWDGFFSPPNYRLFGDGSNQKEALQALQEINNKFK